MGKKSRLDNFSIEPYGGNRIPHLGYFAECQGPFFSMKNGPYSSIHRNVQWGKPSSILVPAAIATKPSLLNLLSGS